MGRLFNGVAHAIRGYVTTGFTVGGAAVGAVLGGLGGGAAAGAVSGGALAIPGAGYGAAQGAAYGSAIGYVAANVTLIAADAIENWMLSEGESSSTQGGTIYVDPNGNAIVAPEGGKIEGSPDGKYIQVKGPDGKPTGVRIDGGHKPSTHPDTRAQKPHAHVPGVNNPDGTPWLPVK
jgi:hypothetical protein